MPSAAAWNRALPSHLSTVILTIFMGCQCEWTLKSHRVSPVLPKTRSAKRWPVVSMVLSQLSVWARHTLATVLRASHNLTFFFFLSWLIYMETQQVRGAPLFKGLGLESVRLWLVQGKEWGGVGWEGGCGHWEQVSNWHRKNGFPFLKDQNLIIVEHFWERNRSSLSANYDQIWCAIKISTHSLKR